MSKSTARSYTSPTMVLLAFDWADGAGLHDFLGFAIRRTPGFFGHQVDWLPNRIGFGGPAENGGDLDSDGAPIQKFMWWDARFGPDDIGKSFTYEIIPVRGAPGALSPVHEAATKVHVVLPKHVEKGIGTWFNRAVVSSQSFAGLVEKLGVDPKVKPSAEDELKLRTWLANGLETVVPDFLQSSDEVAGAIYHLTDDLWIIPRLKGWATKKACQLVYDSHKVAGRKGEPAKPTPNKPVVDALASRIDWKPRDKTHIMHDKFLVAGTKLRTKKPAVQRLLAGSANFTTEGLTQQANLLHTFDSPELASAYLEREKLLAPNPALAATRKKATWSDLHTVGDAGIRVFFPPEPEDQRASMQAVVDAILAARTSVCFCLFMPTDKELRDACFAMGDNGKMMFGLVNHIAKTEPVPQTKKDGTIQADSLAGIELYHRNRDKKDVIPPEYFHPGNVPAGFKPELLLFPGDKPPPYPPVIIHHKFIVIDAEGDSPKVFSGSANMSTNSTWFNDENLLEIRSSRRIAAIYLAEFLRLYEHYRARAAWIAYKHGKNDTYKLTKDVSWAKQHFTPGTPEWKARRAMVMP